MTHDVIVIGSGAAGLTAALALADKLKVLVLAKGSLTEGSTAWAQGGIAAALDAGDTFEEHIRDTMMAGAGLNRRETVEFVTERAPHAIHRLVELTLDRDLAELPANAAFLKCERTGERSLAITYDKDKANAGQVLALVQQGGAAIIDVTTREPDLEDVFVTLTSAANNSI